MQFQRGFPMMASRAAKLLVCVTAMLFTSAIVSLAQAESDMAVVDSIPAHAPQPNEQDNAASTQKPTVHVPAGPAGIVQITGVPGGSVPWSIVVLLTALTLIPSILLCMTPFARLLIVFHFLRQALGLQTTPSNQTLIGLSLILTFFLMQPVANDIYQQAVLPMEAGRISMVDALSRAEIPVRHFMTHYVREKDLALFIEIAKEPQPASMDDVSMRVLLPSYILSELKAGFQIGTVLFLPFLIVDLVVASITTSVGMLQLPPVVISTPLKLLLFLMVDGWHLLIGSLMRSFN
jgi:flagellar biosynthetic protein FliP